MSYILNGDGSLRIDYYDAPVLNDLTLSVGGNLLPNTTYYYRVFGGGANNLSSNVSYGARSNIKSITTTTNNKTINLSWSNIGAPYYYIMRSVNNNFLDGENNIIGTATLTTNITTNSAIDNGTNYPSLFRWLVREYGIPRLIFYGEKTLKDVYDFVSSLPSPLNTMVKLTWAVDSSETSVVPFTGTYQPLLWFFDFHIYITIGGKLIIKNSVVFVRGLFSVYATAAFQMGEIAASGMTSKGAILFTMHNGYANPSFQGGAKIYDSWIVMAPDWCAPVPSGAGIYQYYLAGINNLFSSRLPSEAIDVSAKSAKRTYVNPPPGLGGSLLLKNFKIEDGEYEQYYDTVTVQGIKVEGRGYGLWIYYDYAKIYNLETYDFSYDLGIHTGSVSGFTEYISFVNPTFKAKNQSNTLDPYIYLATTAQNKWMRIYFELKIKITNADGIPIENVLVQIVTADNMEYSDLTDSNGETILFEVREGKYTFNHGGTTREGYLSNLIAQGYVIKSAGNPITITVSKANFKTQIKTTEILEKSSWVFGMEPITPGITESFNADLLEDSISCSIIEDEISVNISD